MGIAVAVGIGLVAAVCCALMARAYEQRADSYYQAKLKDETFKARAQANKEAREDMERNLAGEKSKLYELIQRFVNIGYVRMEESGRYQIVAQFDPRIIYAARHGDQAEMRYIAHHIGAYIERELLTLNLERFNPAELKRRQQEAERLAQYLAPPISPYAG